MVGGESSGAYFQAYQDQIAHIEELPPRHASYRSPSVSMHARLSDKLAELGLQELYAHQAHAYDEAMQGKDLVVVTEIGRAHV